MAVEFTNEEIELIDAQALPPSEKPSYYSALPRQFRQISTDFEGYLILQNQTQKQKALTWIQQSTEIETANEDRDEILERYLTIRQQNAVDTIVELDARLNNYADFQNGLLTDGSDPARFAQIQEINEMVRALGRPLNKITIQREQHFHEQNLVNVLKGRLDQEKTTEDTQNELTSWQTVISTYAGQPTQEGSQSDTGATQLSNEDIPKLALGIN